MRRCCPDNQSHATLPCPSIFHCSHLFALPLRVSPSTLPSSIVFVESCFKMRHKQVSFCVLIIVINCPIYLSVTLFELFCYISSQRRIFFSCLLCFEYIFCAHVEVVGKTHFLFFTFPNIFKIILWLRYCDYTCADI